MAHNKQGGHMAKRARNAKRKERRATEESTRIGYDGQIPPREMAVRDPEGEGKRSITVKYRMDRLDWLHARAERTGIHRHHVEAGHRLQRDWERAEMMVMASIGGSGRSTPGNCVADEKLMAQQRYGDAVSKLPPDIRRLVEIVLLESGNHSLEHAAAIIRVHRMAALPLLRSGLEILAQHYRLA